MELAEKRHKSEIAEMNMQLQTMAKTYEEEQSKTTELKYALANSEHKVSELEKALKKSMPKYEIEKNLSRIFTPGQIKMVLNPKLTKITWSEEDISAAMTARSYGNASYEYWRCTRNVPMPAPSTLRKRSSALNFEPGVLKSVFNHMKMKSSEMELRETLCTLAFDEIHISRQVDIDKKTEQVVRINFAKYSFFENEKKLFRLTSD